MFGKDGKDGKDAKDSKSPGVNAGAAPGGANGGDKSATQRTRTVTVMRVTSSKEGFRRCGRAFGKVPVDIHQGEITEAEAKALLEEPNLHCVPAQVEVPAE